MSQTLPLLPDMRHIIKRLDNKEQSGDIKRMFYEAKAMEFLSIQLAQLEISYQQDAKQSFLKTYDIDKVYRAKNIIEQNMQTPCSLIELSRKVGLNDFKLKKGFKEIFGTTVFTYLSDFRMEKARYMLTEMKNVGEVSHAVGYKNQHHFTAAFKKKYGLLPSEFIKSSN